MKNAVVEFKDYSFQYRSQAEKTLNRINLTIYQGEKVLIVGPSGSGKSTMAHCINGLIPLSYDGEISGSLKVMGKEAADESIFGLSKMVGTVLQDLDGQFIGLTVAEDIAFALENDCTAQDEMVERVFETSKLVDVQDHLTNAPYELSGGQKQRVSLAGVMVDDVSVLLFDEPLASLDPATGKQAITLIDEIHQRTNVTVIIIEHRLEDVLHGHMDRIIVMNDGAVVADLHPDELLERGILADCGLREPLYISALRYAGCPVKKEMRLADLQKLDLSGASDGLKRFYDRVEPEEPSGSQENILELAHVTFSYGGGVEALQDVSLTIKKGEMLSVIGKNGAGKSTMSSLICGFVKPTSGAIYYAGRDVKDDTIRERAERIGMVMQNPNDMLSKNMIFDEVALGLVVRGVPEETVRERVNETLKVCGLHPFRNWPVSALSYGQKKRVTIASILALSPEVIILDEPTAGQDFRNYTEIMEFLRRLNENGTTVMIITHDMHLMLEYTRRAVVLADGQILFDGPSVTALTDPVIIERANLKETSLFTLAVNAGLDDPEGFVWKYIAYDRGGRRHA